MFAVCLEHVCSIAKLEATLKEERKAWKKVAFCLEKIAFYVGRINALHHAGLWARRHSATRTPVYAQRNAHGEVFTTRTKTLFASIKKSTPIWPF
jgi:hypothetical protein